MAQTRIAVAARKGGIGKTSIACGLGSVVASQGKKVLVIDLDPQSNAAYLLGTNPTAPGTADLLSGGSPAPLEASSGLYILPGGPDLAGHTIQSLDPEDLADAVAQMDYEVLIFDCPPGVEYLERLGLVAADVALICTDAHSLAVMGAGRVINELKLRQQKGRRGAKRWALALSRMDLRRSMDQALDKQLAAAYPAIDRSLYLAYREQGENVLQLVAQIPWGHNTVLLEKVKDPAEREWYLQQALDQGWSRNILVHQIESKLYARQVSQTKSHNFEQTLPSPRSELVEQALKDPYVLDFLTLKKGAKERDLQNAILAKLRDFLVELGNGFAFMGSEYPLRVSDQDFFLDLLFYHYRLRCLVVIDLKIGEFKPEDAGKMNFYLSALDAQVKHPDERPSVGIILCKSKDRLIADYALANLNRAIGVSTYETGEVPSELQAELPTVQQLQQALDFADLEDVSE